MRDVRKTKAQLVRELGTMRTKVKRLETWIDKHKRAEASLRESEERFRLLIEKSEEAILDTQPDGQILSANPAACRMLGRSEAEIRKIGRAGVVDTTDPRLKAGLEKRAKVSKARAELDLIRSDGTIFPAEVSSVVFRDSLGNKRTSMFIADITERKHMERALQESEEKYRRIVETAAEGIWVLDKEWKTTYVNPAMAEMLGYTSEEFMQRAPTDVVPEEEVPKVTERMRRRENGSAEKTVTRMRRKDGSTIWTESNAAPLFNNKGEYNGAIALVADVTERKKMDAELKEAEAYLRTVLNSAPITIFAMDSLGVFTLSEGRGLGRVGLKPGENVGLSAFDLFSSIPFMEYNGQVTTGKEVIGRVLSGETVSAIDELNGVYFDNHIVPIRGEDEKIVGIVGVATDITERKRAEDALRKSEERFRAVFDQGTNGMIFMNAERKITHVNTWYNRVLGYDLDELVGHSGMEFIYREDQDQTAQAFQRLLHSAGKAISTEHRLRCKDGSSRWVETVGINLLDNPLVKAVVMNQCDITDRKLAEEALRESEDKYRGLYLNSALGIFHSTFEGKFIDVNPSLASLLGYDSPEEVVRCITNIAEQVYVEPSLHDSVATAVLNAGNVFKTENLYRRKDGSLWNAMLHLRIVRDQQGKASHYEGFVEDITDRKQAESNLKQSVEWQQAIFEGSRDAVFISDENSRFVAVNAAASSLTGYSRQQLLTMKIPDLHDHPDMAAYEQFHSKILEGADNLTEAKILRCDGTKVETEFNNKRVSISGKLYMHTTARDISERKQAEEKLRASEAKFRALFDRAGYAMGMAKDGIQLMVNEAYRDLFGYENVSELIGRPILNDISPEEHARLGEFIRRRLQKETAPSLYETRGIRRDGSVFDMDVRTTTYESGGEIYTIGILRDITERKQMEDALKREHALLSTIIETIPDELCVKDTNSRFILANRTCVAALGATSAEEMIGKTDLDYIRREIALPLLDEEKQILESGEPSIAREMVRLDPKTGYINKCDLYTKVPIKGEDGRATGLLVLNMDITKRKLAEENLKRSEERLRQLSVHLESVREEERKHIAQEFHDQLGQTLTAMKMDLSLLERELSDEKKNLSRDTLLGEIHSSQKLVDLGIQTVRSIMSELRPELLDQLGLVEALEWEIGKFQKRSGILCGLSAEIGDLQLDANRSIALFRLVQESLTNVARHAQAKSVDVILRTESNNLILEIRDDGIGISADDENKPRAFGLIGMRERANFLGGKLEIKGAAGKGTTITVRIPVHESLLNGGGTE